MSQPPQPPRPGPPSRPPGPPGAGPPSGNFIYHNFFLRWNTSASFFSLKIYCIFFFVISLFVSDFE